MCHNLGGRICFGAEKSAILWTPMVIKLIIGLGNPDAEYENTRHNLGFLFIESLASDHGSDLILDKKIGARVAKSKMILGGKNYSVIFARPESYVNTSGPIIAKLKAVYKARPEDIIIVHDDLDIPFGSVKLSFDKNSGGHRGVESIMKAIKTKKFFRIRLGTANSTLKKAYNQGENAKDALIKNFVLAKLTPKEKGELKKLFKDAKDLLSSSGTQLAR